MKLLGCIPQQVTLYRDHLPALYSYTEENVEYSP